MLAAGYPTKKSLKESKGKRLNFTETSMFGKQYLSNGQFAVVGPSPYNRKWYAQVTMRDDLIVKVS